LSKTAISFLLCGDYRDALIHRTMLMIDYHQSVSTVPGSSSVVQRGEQREIQFGAPHPYLLGRNSS
jgi:hypothetical protein